MLHSGRLTWNLKITYLKRKIIFQTSIIMFHVNLRGCIYLDFLASVPLDFSQVFDSLSFVGGHEGVIILPNPNKAQKIGEIHQHYHTLYCLIPKKIGNLVTPVMFHLPLNLCFKKKTSEKKISCSASFSFNCMMVWSPFVTPNYRLTW